LSDRPLFLVSANKSRLSGQPWPDDDYEVRDGAADGPVIGRIYKQDFSPSGTPWFWGLLILPAMAADRGTAETREAAMAELKARWLERMAG
jgi:hypothetical protein